LTFIPNLDATGKALGHGRLSCPGVVYVDASMLELAARRMNRRERLEY
jgi:hypothetical protein